MQLAPRLACGWPSDEKMDRKLKGHFIMKFILTIYLQFKVDIDYFKSFIYGNPKDYMLMILRKTK